MVSHSLCFPLRPLGRCIPGYGRILAFALVAWVFAGPAAAPSVAEGFYGSANSKVYHSRRACQSGRKIKLENRVRFSSEDDAKGQGRRLCRFCERMQKKEEEGDKNQAPQVGKGEPENTTTPTGVRGKGKDRPRSSVPPDGSINNDSTTAKELPQTGTVKKVFPDGTIELVSGDRVRLLGVGCPRRGQDVAGTIKDQTADREVSLVYDPATSHCGHRDGMGRLWAYIQVDPDNRDVGAELIFRGAAWFDRELAFGRRKTYIAREDQAWWAGRGVWKRLEGVDGNRKVVVGRYGSHYYAVGSPWILLLKDPTTITVNEAKSRRLTPCQKVRPTSKKKSGQKKRGKKKA